MWKHANMVWYQRLPNKKKLNTQLGECKKEIKPTELFIKERVLRGHIVTRVGVSVSHEPDIDRKIRGLITLEESLRKETTEEEVLRVAKEVQKNKNKRNGLPNPQLSCKGVLV